MANGDLAMLVGNGLSIAFNPDMQLGTITKQVTDRLTEKYKEKDTEVARAMHQVAKRAHAKNSENDFEDLIGAFGGQSDILGDLNNYARLTEDGDPDLSQAIKKVREFVQAVRQRGIGHTLEVITESSKPGNGTFSVISDFVKLATQSFSDKITIANLNYDALILTELSDDYRYRNDFCDLGAGYGKKERTDLLDVSVTTYQIRTKSDLINRIRLLDLHGAVTFWRFGDSHVKIPLAIARNNQLWEKYRTGEIDAEPLVVLANQDDKADHVQRQPYRLAYDIADTDFRNCAHWLIAGYSFKDSCVNDLLKRAWDVRQEREAPTRILIVTKGGFPSTNDIESAFGWAPGTFLEHHANIDTDGVVGLGERAAWKWFVAA